MRLKCIWNYNAIIYDITGTCSHLCCWISRSLIWRISQLVFYAALLPRRGPHIASHSVCPSVRLSVCPSVCPSVPLSIVTSRHLANYNDTHVLFDTRWWPHIVRPSRPHKFLFIKWYMIVCKHYFSVTIYGFCVSCNVRALYFAAACYEVNLVTRRDQTRRMCNAWIDANWYSVVKTTVRLRFDCVRLLIKGHYGHSDVTH